MPRRCITLVSTKSGQAQRGTKPLVTSPTDLRSPRQAGRPNSQVGAESKAVFGPPQNRRGEPERRAASRPIPIHRRRQRSHLARSPSAHTLHSLSGDVGAINPTNELAAKVCPSSLVLRPSSVFVSARLPAPLHGLRRLGSRQPGGRLSLPRQGLRPTALASRASTKRVRAPLGAKEPRYAAQEEENDEDRKRDRQDHRERQG